MHTLITSGNKRTPAGPDLRSGALTRWGRRTFTALCVLCGCLSPLTVRAATFTGTILDTESSAPIGGVTIRLSDGVAALSAADGSFTLFGEPGASSEVTFTHVGYHALARSIRFTERSRPVTIYLTPLAIPLEELTVTADPLGPSDIHRRPAFATVITRDSFEGRATSLPEVLSQSTGVQVKSLGGLGAFSTISLRGSSAEQVEIYLDGILLNAASGGGVDLSNVPLEQVERIEVYRGAGSEGSGIGGTVHIRTRASEKPAHGLAASWGSFDTRTLGGTLSGRHASSNFLVVADYRASDNDYRFLDDNGTEYNTTDDEVTNRRNNQSTQASLLGRWRRAFEHGRSLSVHGSLFGKRQGIPGISNNQSTEAGLESTRVLGEAVYEDAELSGALSTRHTVYATNTSERYHDLLGEVGLGRQDNRYRTTTFGWRGMLRAVVSNRHFVTFGATTGREAHVPTIGTQGSETYVSSRRWNTSARAAADLALPADRGVLSPSIEVRHLRSVFEGVTPFAFSPTSPDTVTTRTLATLRAGLRFDLAGDLHLKANIGRTHRPASFLELFGDRGGVVGNSDLRPERGLTWDAGFRYDTRRSSVEIAWFDHRYDDLIQFVQTSQATSRPVNIGKAVARGLELTVSRRLGSHLEMSGNYTWQLTADRSDIAYLTGNQLPNRPPHALFGRIKGTLDRYTVTYEYTFEDGNFLDRANRRALAARHIHNARVAVALPASVELGLDARNLGDAQIADVWGYPLPGRALFVGIRRNH